jgi:uncharacterized membrane protein
MLGIGVLTPIFFLHLISVICKMVWKPSEIHWQSSGWLQKIDLTCESMIFVVESVCGAQASKAQQRQISTSTRVFHGKSANLAWRLTQV